MYSSTSHDALPVGPNEDYLMTDQEPTSVVVFEKLRDGRVRVTTGDSNGAMVTVRYADAQPVELRPGGEWFVNAGHLLSLRFRDPSGLSNG